MPRERLRLVSRRGGARGGSRGRVVQQRSSTTSNPSSDELESPASRRGRGRGRGRARNEDCEHSAHPTTRFRIPCNLANSSFIVSVTIEKCENTAQPGASSKQRQANTTIVQHQGSQPAVNPGAVAGPSEPAKNAVLQSDSSDSEQYGCRIVEEQASTSMDE